MRNVRNGRYAYGCGACTCVCVEAVKRHHVLWCNYDIIKFSGPLGLLAHTYVKKPVECRLKLLEACGIKHVSLFYMNSHSQ